MKRATITIPDDLEAALNRHLSRQDASPSLTAIVQVALRDYLRNAELEARGYRPPSQPFQPCPLEEKDDKGEPDVSINHDAYIGKP
jgi:hypothetical protein